MINHLGKDNVNTPAHYTKGGIEMFDFLKAKLSKEELRGFVVGSVLQYVTRAQSKNGVEDYKKAVWYLNKLIEVENETC